jgi:PBP superfamily domain
LAAPKGQSDGRRAPRLMSTFLAVRNLCWLEVAAYGLAFMPLAAERFDLVIPAAQAGSREVQALLRA